MKNDENISINQRKNKNIKKNTDNEEDSLNELNVHKLQIENAKKDSELMKLRKELQQFKQYGFDTSSTFPWPNEFKNRWETLVHTMIMDNFDSINTNYILLMRTINIVVKTIYDISKNQIRQKVIDLLKCLGLQNISDINISNFYNKFQRLLFQDFFKTLFIANNELYNSIITKIKNEIFKNKKLFTQNEIEDILNDINNANITNFIREIYFICLYMNLNEPKLTIKTSTDINYRYYNKNEYDIIEGFAKNKGICIIILNPPMIGHNKPYNGIKPAVFIIENPTKEIIDTCENQNNNKSNIIYDSIIQISSEESRKKLINDKGDNYKKKYNLIKNSLNNSNDNDENELNSNANTISSDLKENFPNQYLTINYKINDNAEYKEREEQIKKKDFSKTINRKVVMKIKTSPDYLLKKNIINPINIQKYIKKDGKKQAQKNLKEKLKNAHIINPQKILNINKTKNFPSAKTKIIKVKDIERYNSIENNANKYTLTEANISISTPFAYSILDTTNNMINLMDMKKKLGLLFYSNNKSQSPSIFKIYDKKTTNKAKKHIMPRRLSNILKQLTIKNNKIKSKDEKPNYNEIKYERISTDIKQNNKNYSMNSNFKERLSYTKNSNIKDNIHDIIDSDLILKTILDNNGNDLINNIQKRKILQKSKNNLKNINTAFILNDNIKNNSYNNTENKTNTQDKYSLRRKINKSINIAREKDINKNININSINSTNNNNNININININNNNNTNENNFRRNVILNYENNSAKITKTEPDVPKRIKESFRKKNINKYMIKKNTKNLNMKKKQNLQMNINSQMKKIINLKNDNYNIFESSIKNNKEINYKANNNSLTEINNGINYNNSIEPLSYNIINKNNLKSHQNIIKNRVKKSNNNSGCLNLNNHLFIKNNKFKYLYNSQNYFPKKNKKGSKNKELNNNNKNINININNLNKRSESLEPAHQKYYYSTEKSQHKRIHSNYNNTINNNKKNIGADENRNEKKNKSNNSIKKYTKKNNKNKKQQIYSINNNYSLKTQNKKYFMSITLNTSNKNNKNKQSEINPNNLKMNNNNNILSKSTDINSYKSSKNVNNKISSSDGIKLNFEKNKYNIKKAIIIKNKIF